MDPMLVGSHCPGQGAVPPPCGSHRAESQGADVPDRDGPHGPFTKGVE